MEALSDMPGGGLRLARPGFNDVPGLRYANPGYKRVASKTFKAKVIDYGKDSLLLEFVQTATKNDAVVKLITPVALPLTYRGYSTVRFGSPGNGQFQ